jgi:cytidyltransferase-like protein
MKTVVLVTGGFDPLHSGHIEYFKYAKSLGDELWVGLNSDEWLTRKKGRPFMPFGERMAIIQNLFMVDAVLDFDDSDGSACGAKVKELVIEPGKSLSMQKHFKRAEMWYVLKGMCKCKTEVNNIQNDVTLQSLTKGYDIGVEVWHQGYNPFNEPCHILEVQHGEECVEIDIERRDVDDNYAKGQ